MLEKKKPYFKVMVFAALCGDARKKSGGLTFSMLQLLLVNSSCVCLFNFDAFSVALAVTAPLISHRFYKTILFFFIYIEYTE